LHASLAAHRLRPWLAAIAGSAALLLLLPAAGHAESNPNNYNCLGTTAAGTPEEGSEGQAVKYSFYCDGPITGYQVQSQIPLSGIQSPPTVTNPTGVVLADTFSCSGEIPGYAVNCVGAARSGYELVSGQFTIPTKLCAEPRVDPLLTVTYAYLEKGVITQAISGPFDLGRPLGCKPDALSGSTRLNPHSPVNSHKRGRHARKGKKARRSSHRR
jgi:hypothetical protein